MSSTVTSSASALPTSVLSGLSQGGNGQKTQGQSTGAFLSAIVTSLAIFGVQVGVFLLIHGRIARIYQPRTYLVPERERTKPPPKGILSWIGPVFHTTNAEFIQKCGLDAYFFLRYLRTLLKIFVPLAFLILPILLPVNAAYGRGPSFATGPYSYNNSYTNVTGLDRLAWGNVKPTKNSRYWAHFLLALVVIIYTCYVLFDELRSYIRLRQAYLTSPQHRLRASATTVLVTAIPTKWCTFEALDGLYDVYPGGIRNIWINRDYDELNDKVKWRNRLASDLESAETNLIKNAKKAQMKKARAEAKKAGKKSAKSDEVTAGNESGLVMAQTDGLSSGDPHQTRHTIDEALQDSAGEPTRDLPPGGDRYLIPIPVLGQGIQVVGRRLDTVGKTVFGGFKKATRDLDETLNTTGGFVPPTPETTTDQEHARDNVSKYRTDVTRTQSIFPEPEHDLATRQAIQRGPLSDHREVSGSTVRQSSSQDGEKHTQQEQQQDPSQQGLAIDGAPVDTSTDEHGLADDILQNPERIGEVDGENTVSKLKFWKRRSNVPYGIPSPTPHGQEEDEFPLSRPSPITPGCNPQAIINGKSFQSSEALDGSSANRTMKQDTKEKKGIEYPTAIEDSNPSRGDPKWRAYIKEKDRETMRLPISGWRWPWMPSIPLIGKKVDAIDYCRKEVARLNLEIEEDQKHPEKYPLMNSAFVQFNHQVAAHMACQAVSHHTPSQMAPRLVEISPDDVIWDNMSIKWWESYLRTGAVLGVIVVLIVFWAVPVSFTGLLSNLDYLQTLNKLRWLARIPSPVKAIIQGTIPQLLLGALLSVLPVIMRLIAQLRGDHTGMAVELSVQRYYFAFLFVQVFLVVSVSSGITVIIPEIINNPISIPSLLASNLPKASNYFFSYMLLQALSVSSGALAQISALVSWYVLAPLLDTTARQKWVRQVTLPTVHWGSFFPVYSNLACIGLIYSVISPLMMIFNIITFCLFWLVYRYNTLYVTKFRFDTGGLLYPRAIKQLFVGLYVMELVLIGLLFLVRDTKVEDGHVVPDGNTTPCRAQAIMMLIIFLLTALYQYLLFEAFDPLIRYLPITLEDEAVMRDEQFARAQEKRWMLEAHGEEDDHTESRIQEQAHPSMGERRGNEIIEMQDMKNQREYYALDPRNVGQKLGNLVPGKASWADRSRNRAYKSPNPAGHVALTPHQPHRHHHPKTPDLEGQRANTNAMGEAFFAGINDEIEDLTPDERDKLVQRAFLHEALRARRPVIWIPRDDLGVSDDEIERTRAYSKYIWINNGYTGLDGKGNVIYRKSPPDFSEVDLIEL